MPKDLSSRNVPTGRSDSKEPKPRHLKSFNVFPAMSHKHLTSHRYGDISPFFYFYGTRGDTVPLITKQEIGTFTLQSPIESDIWSNRTYIKVNHQAIYPKNWEYMRVIQQNSQDVPDHMRMEVNIPYICQALSTKIAEYRAMLAESDGADIAMPLTNIVKCILSLELLLSEGSLFSMFNMHIDSTSVFEFLTDSGLKSFDQWLDVSFYPALSRFITSHTNTLYVTMANGDDSEFSIVSDSSLNGDVYGRGFVSFRFALEIMRHHSFSLGFSDFSRPNQDMDVLIDAISEFPEYDFGNKSYFDGYQVNAEVIAAYQLACAQFFTDDKIDNVFTSDSYIDAVRHTAKQMYGETQINNKTYTLNGIDRYYDCFNGQYLSLFFTSFAAAPYSSNSMMSVAWDFIRLLFGFRKSLKFGNYFTSARANLLSGNPEDDYKAVVDGGAVSAVSMARSMMFTRLRHTVNLTGSRLSDYLSGVFGGDLLSADRDQPQWLAQQSFKVKGYEIENTGTAQEDKSQNLITTILKTSDQKFSFKTFVDDQCIILGLQTYDVDIVYSNTVDRHSLHFDRYDDMIPQLQFVGDQEIYQREINGIMAPMVPWAYSERYQEYKKRTSYASGAYIRNLPSYAFISDNTEGTPAGSYINPDYIRSQSVEFDRFFSSLSGYSLSSYFHFRIKSIHDLSELKRNMVKHPQILK